MFFGTDWLTNLYIGCFLFGLFFTAVALFFNLGHFGGAHGHVGHAAHGPHVGGHGQSGAHGHGTQHTAPTHGPLPNIAEQMDSLSPLNVPTVMASLTWFGGSGYIYRNSLGFDGATSLVFAVCTALVGGWLLFIILSRVLWAGQTMPMRRADYFLPGTHARVVSSIAAGGTGEIVFIKGGSRRVEGARSEDGTPLPKGIEVVIARYEKGLAYVQPLTGLSDTTPPESARVDKLHEETTQPLNAGLPAVTHDLRTRQ